jgi:hypothetical protein
MAGNVELRHHPDPTIRGIGDDLADLGLGVVKPVRTELMEPGEDFALDPKPLILGQVPMKDVHFDRGQAVEVAFDDLDRLEVPAAVDQQAPPGESRRVFDLDAGDEISVGITGEKLQDGFKSVKNAQIGRGDEKNPVRADRDVVGFVLSGNEGS